MKGEDSMSSKRTLLWLGLLGPIKAFPALLATIAASIAALEVSWLSLPTATLEQMSAMQVLIVVGGSLIGLIAHRSGNVWDAWVFNPRYGIDGSWLEKRAGLFPSGLDLAAARSAAVETIFGNTHSGVGVYREASDRVRKQEQEWNYVQTPLTLSKLARSFIWPFVLAALGFFAVTVLSFLQGHSILILVTGIVVSLTMATLLFVPYFDLRIEHMIRLYRAVARSQA